MSKKADNFRNELRHLLNRYDARISFNWDTSPDTDRPCNERLEVTISHGFDMKFGKRVRNPDETVVLNLGGWSVEANDL